MEILIAVAIFIGAFLLGGISPSVLISRKIGGFDVRSVGSGNAGTTNILRSMGWRFGVANLLLDMLKGFLPVLVIKLIWGMDTPLGLYATLAAGLGSVLGHCFSPYMGFKGGKGVATSLGVFLAITPISTALALAVAVLVIVFTRYVSAGSLVGALAVIAFETILGRPVRIEILVLLVAVFLVLSFMHRGNIKRLFQGEENRLVFKNIKK